MTPVKRSPEEPSCGLGLFGCFGPSPEKSGAVGPAASVAKPSIVQTVPPPVVEEVATPVAIAAEVVPDIVATEDAEPVSMERGLPEEDVEAIEAVEEEALEVIADAIEALEAEVGTEDGEPSVIDLDKASVAHSAKSLAYSAVGSYARSKRTAYSVVETEPVMAIEVYSPASTPDIWAKLMIPKPSIPVMILGVVFWPITIFLVVANYILNKAYVSFFPPAPTPVIVADTPMLDEASGQYDPAVAAAAAEMVSDMVSEILKSLPMEGAAESPLTRDSVGSMKSAISQMSRRSTRSRGPSAGGAKMASAEKAAAVALARESLSNLARASMKLQSRAASVMIAAEATNVAAVVEAAADAELAMAEVAAETTVEAVENVSESVEPDSVVVEGTTVVGSETTENFDVVIEKTSVKPTLETIPDAPLIAA